MSLIQDAETLDKARAVAARVKSTYAAGSDAWVAATYLSDILSPDIQSVLEMKVASLSEANLRGQANDGQTATLELLNCAVCDAARSFVIDPRDPAVGYCFAEKQAWRIRSGYRTRT